MSSITCCCKKLSFVFALLAVTVLAAPVFGASSDTGTCLQDEYNQFTNVSPKNGSCASTPSSNSLVCTANDVSVSQVDPASVFILTNGTNTPTPSCFQGQNFNFVADFDILTTANATNAGGRDNVGLYFASSPSNPSIPNGKSTSQALCGTCIDNIISAPHLASGASCTPTFPSSTCFGSDNYHEYDTGVTTSGGKADNCGDTSSTDNSPHYGIGSEGVTIEVDDYSCSGNTSPCANDPTKQCLLMQYCTSWQVPGSVNACFSDPSLGWPYTNAATPGSKSKCNCSTVQLPITPISVTATAQKACTTSITTGPATFTASTQSPTSCDEGPEGQDAATYYVNVTASATSGNAIVDQICDTAYGTIYDDGYVNPATGKAAFAACATGTVGGTVTGGCTSGMTLSGNPPTGQCSFTAPAIGETTSVSDQVTVSGHSSVSGSTLFSTPKSNSVNAFSEDAPATAAVDKEFVANTAACVNVRYSVDVKNTSGADETLGLTGLTDNPAGDITTLSTNILGTTCNVATSSPGLGTFTGKCSCNTAGCAGTCTSGSINAACSADATCNINGGGLFSAVTLGVSGSGTSDYNCQFETQICSNLDSSGCFTHSDTVTAGLSLDNSETNNSTGACTDSSGNPVACLTETKNTLTLKECVTGTKQ